VSVWGPWPEPSNALIYDIEESDVGELDILVVPPNSVGVYLPRCTM
jgi:hypothetical protein